LKSVCDFMWPWPSDTQSWSFHAVALWTTAANWHQSRLCRFKIIMFTSSVTDGLVENIVHLPASLAWWRHLRGKTEYCCCVHLWQRRCQEDPVSLPSGILEKTTRSSPHHVAQHHPTGSETTPPYAPRSSRFGSEPPSVEDDVDVWRYAIVSCMPETTTTFIYDRAQLCFRR